jgi:ABC-2 type transport system ATP-binding protein
MIMIKCVSLTKNYGKENNAALDNLNIEVSKNSVYGFLGPNGAGKTTTVKILTGLMRQTSGDFFIAGLPNNINSVELRKKIGYLGQEPRMYSGMKAKNLLMFVGELFGQSKLLRDKKADELLEMAGLSNAAGKKISEFSGGMVQRLGIAQALMGNPEVLFLDEPTSALDPIGRKEVLEFIYNLKETCTVFMSTHILSDVERVCDTVAIINKGKLIVQEKTEALKKKYSDKIIEIEFTDNRNTEIFENKIKTVKTAGIISSSQNIIRIHPENLNRDKSDFLKIISSSELEIEKFEVLTANLEDIFVKLVGGKENEK